MKLLLLYPHSELRQKLTQGLKDRGAVVLSAATIAEAKAFLKTHGTTVEIAVIHREGTGGIGEPGEALFKELKADAKQSDLPVIFTSEVWRDPDFSKHQNKDGANAYLKSPFTSAQLIECVNSVIGGEWGGTNAIGSQPEYKGAMGKVFKLEDAASIYKSHAKPAGELSIQFEMPDSEGEFKTAPPSVAETVPESSPEMPVEPSSEVPVLAQDASVTRFESSPAETGSADSGGISLSAGPEMELASVIDFGQDKRAEELPIEGDPLPEISASHNQPLELSADGEIPLDPATEAVAASTDSAATSSSPNDDQPVFNLADAVQPSLQNPIFELPVADNTQLAPTSDTPVFEAVSHGSISPAYEDAEAAQEMPYLYSNSSRHADSKHPAEARAAHPVGDSVVPGGASQTPDLETLKRYLLLREQDVSALSMQLKRAREQVQVLEGDLQTERSMSSDLQLKLEEQNRKIKDFDRELSVGLDSAQTEINNAKFEAKVKTDKLKIFEAKIREAGEETERLKERVRIDIRKIRVREKELENRLEILRKDSEALIAARENKIVELKRKVDLLEFNMDLLQDQHQREKIRSADLREKLSKAAQVVRVAGGLLGEDKISEALATETEAS